MILYFSGTGNSKWVAESLAEGTSDTAIDIIKSPILQSDIDIADKIGVVFPIYAWSVPEPMLNTLSKLNLKGKYIYGVCTCGDDAGTAMKKLSHKYDIKLSYSIIMPNNYIVGFDVDTKEVIKSKISSARETVLQICTDIMSNASGYHVHEGSMASVKTYVAGWGFNKFARNAAKFSVDSNCNGCGLCVTNCPTHIITLKNLKPFWGKKCYQCLSCINRCPKKSIQYGEVTKSRGRYYFKEDYI